VVARPAALELSPTLPLKDSFSSTVRAFFEQHSELIASHAVVLLLAFVARGRQASSARAIAAISLTLTRSVQLYRARQFEEQQAIGCTGVLCVPLASALLYYGALFCVHSTCFVFHSGFFS
jgi:hypothetical protein